MAMAFNTVNSVQRSLGTVRRHPSQQSRWSHSQQQEAVCSVCLWL